MEDKSDNLGCSECVDLLADYVDGALPREEADRLEWHLASCPPCVAFVKTYNGTAPPRSWTLLLALAGFRRQAPRLGACRGPSAALASTKARNASATGERLRSMWVAR